MWKSTKSQGSFGRLSETRWSTGSGLKYSRPGCGNLWLALGLDTRSLDPPWLWFGTLAKAIRQRHNGGHKSGSHAPKPRTRRPHADHGPQPSIICPRCLSLSLSLSLYLSLCASNLVCTLTLLDTVVFIHHRRPPIADGYPRNPSRNVGMFPIPFSNPRVSVVQFLRLCSLFADYMYYCSISIGAEIGP